MGEESQKGTQNLIEEKASIGWAVVFGLAIFFLLWGLLIFWTVGEKGPPGWDFGAMPDIPGQSPYSTQIEQPRPQHVGK